MKILNLKGIGALPVGFKGKINGKSFSIRVQYDAFGGVKAQIFDDEEGSIITIIQGNKGESDLKGIVFGEWAIKGTELAKKVGTYFAKDKADIRKRAKAFIKQLFTEVEDFNKGKDTRIKKVQTVVIAPKPAIKKTAAPKPAPKKAAPKITVKKTVTAKTKSEKRSLEADKKRKAMPPGKRTATGGGVYYEYRRNRTDKPGSKI
jgi:hypothetical protein